MALLVFTIIEAPDYGWAAARSVAGFAASASTVDLSSVEAGLPVDRLWRHLAGAWLADVGMLMTLAAALAGLVRYRLRLGNRAR